MAEKYGAIYPSFWTGETGRKITKCGLEARVVAVYLLSNNYSNHVGLYYLPIPLIAHESGCPPEGALKGLQSLIGTGFCLYDFDTDVVFIPEMAKFQFTKPFTEKDKRIVWVNNLYSEMPKCPFLGMFFDIYRDYLRLENRREMKGVQRATEGASKGDAPSLLITHYSEPLKEPSSDNSAELSGATWRDEFSPEVVEFAESFQRHVREEVGARAPALTDALFKSAVDTIDKLIRLDDHTLEEIRTVMRWAVKDDFWQKNALSLAALRKKRDGLTKFQKILAAKEGDDSPSKNGQYLTAGEKIAQGVKVLEEVERRLTDDIGPVQQGSGSIHNEAPKGVTVLHPARIAGPSDFYTGGSEVAPGFEQETGDGVGSWRR